MSDSTRKIAGNDPLACSIQLKTGQLFESGQLEGYSISIERFPVEALLTGDGDGVAAGRLGEGEVAQRIDAASEGAGRVDAKTGDG